VHGTVKEVVAERFAREQPALAPLPAQRYDTSYHELRHVSWDAYIEVRGNRYSVPAELAGQTVAVRINLDDTLRVYVGERLVATHTLQMGRKGWVTQSEHHAALWDKTLGVERRPLDIYEEAATWN
jgi:Mu transposase, C-terminal